MSDIPIELRPSDKTPKIDVTPEHVEPSQVILTIQMIRMQAILDGAAPDEEMGKLLTNTAKTAIDQTKIKSGEENASAEREQSMAIHIEINKMRRNPLHKDSLLYDQPANYTDPDLPEHEPVKDEYSVEQATLVYKE